AGIGVELHSLERRTDVVERLGAKLTDSLIEAPHMAERVVTAFMRHQEMTVGGGRRERGGIHQDEGTSVRVHRRRRLLGEVRQQARRNCAIWVVDGRQSCLS